MGGDVKKGQQSRVEIIERSLIRMKVVMRRYGEASLKIIFSKRDKEYQVPIYIISQNDTILSQ